MKLQGIDLSKWNTVPDYNKLSSSGLAFAYIKASESAHTDPTYTAKHDAIAETGLLRGSYHFYRASTDPIVQAEAFLRAFGGTIGDGEMPPVLDIEDTSATLTTKQYEDSVSAWLNHVEQATGVQPMIYTGGWYWKELQTLNNSSKFKNYPLWLASYTPTFGPMFGGWTAPQIWQYTEKGNVAGINPVDLDYFYGSAEDLWAFARMKPIAADPGYAPKAKAVQQRLAALGLYASTVDGLFGNMTKNAVIAFQTSKGLTADGIVGTETWAALFNVRIL
jgi:lysozyme